MLVGTEWRSHLAGIDKIPLAELSEDTEKNLKDSERCGLVRRFSRIDAWSTPNLNPVVNGLRAVHYAAPGTAIEGRD